MTTIADEIAFLTLDAGARRLGVVLDVLKAQVDNCCSGDNVPVAAEKRLATLYQRVEDAEAKLARLVKAAEESAAAALKPAT